MAGTLKQPREGWTVVEAARQKRRMRFNTGRIPESGEIAAGDDKDLDVSGFVDKADVEQVRVFAEGNDPTDFDLEFFSKATSDSSPASDRYRQYQWQHINTQDVDGADVPIILEDEEPPVSGSTVDRPMSKDLHVRVTNNGADTMHVTDIEIIFRPLKM